VSRSHGSGEPVVRFLVHGAERSGPPIHVLRLCRWWAAHRPSFGPEVVLARPGELSAEFAALAPTSTARLDRRSPERVGQRVLDALGLHGPGDALVTGATRARVRGNPDVTVVNGATAPTAALLRMLRPDGPVIMIAHELSTGWRANISDDDRALLLDRVQGFAAVSRSVAAYLTSLGVSGERIEVIPPAVEASSPPATERDTGRDHVVVGGGGTTDWRKAPELWLRLAREVVDAEPDRDIRFVWFGGEVPGDGAGWPLRHEIDRLGLGDRVRFLGSVDDPATVLDDVDVFVSTAREDAAPLVCAEAAGRGCAVVTFDSGGAGELVGDSGGGLIVPYPDISMLADAVVRLLRDRRYCAELGMKGAAFVRQQRDVSLVAPATASWIERWS